MQCLHHSLVFSVVRSPAEEIHHTLMHSSSALSAATEHKNVAISDFISCHCYAVCMLQITMYTGFVNCGSFHLVVSTLQRFELVYYYGWTVQMPMEDQLLVTLMKLRLNVPMLDLAVRFGVSRTTVANIFTTLICALHDVFFKQCMKSVPSKQKTVASLPDCFSIFPSCRQIFDCTEIAIEVPRQDMTANRMTYSSYKSKNTFKALISVSPNGAIVFCSDLFTGNTSDKEIVVQSGILNTLEVGDLVLADKGFLIHDVLPPGVTVNLPSFLPSDSRQFSREQVVQSRAISRARIHVERAIQRVKEFNMLDNIEHHQRNLANRIFQVAVSLVNLQAPIIANTPRRHTP